MKVLLVTPYFYPKIGGVERHTFTIAQGLSAAGHTVHVITTQVDDLPKHEAVDDIIISRLPINVKLSMTPFGFLWYWQIKKIIREFNPDIIETHSPVPGLADVAFFARSGKKYVIKYHSGSMKKGIPILDTILGLYESTLLKYIFIKSDAIMAVYPNFIDKLINYKRSTYFIPPGVNTSMFKYKKTPKRYDILFVGRIEHASDWKGIDTLLEAIKIVKKSHKNFKAALVGSGDAVEHFKDQASLLGIEKNVVFLGSQQGEDLVSTYNQSKILVLPSKTEAESFGNVLIEAMACRVPTIGSRIGGIPNVISDKEDGLLFEPSNPKSLAKCIEKLIGNPSYAQKLAVAGQKKALSKFSSDHLIQATNDLLKKTLAKGARK